MPQSKLTLVRSGITLVNQAQVKEESPEHGSIYAIASQRPQLADGQAQI